MDFWSEGTLKSFLLPGGPLLLIAVLVLSGVVFTPPAIAVQFYYYAVFAMGVLLAWRFHSGRVLFALLTLLLAERALEFFAGPKLLHVGPGRTAFEVLSLLLPINLLVLSFLRERGLGIAAAGPRLIAIFIQSVGVAVLCRPGQTYRLMAAANAGRHSEWLGWTPIPDFSTIAFLVVSGALLVRGFRTRKAVDIGFFWSAVAIFLAFHSGGVGRVAAGFMATSGLFLLIALVETSYSMAYNDELTTLPGRRAFNETLVGLGERYAVAVVDIDHFKQFNDNYGHDTGDQVLRMVAGQLARVTGGGKAFRCGGEEFAIVFGEKSAKDVLEHLELLRASIEKSVFRIRSRERRVAPRQEPDRRQGQTRKRRSVVPKTSPESVEQGQSVTVSIGVAEPGARNRDVDQVIAAADKALYRAKAMGRNRVEMAGSSRMKLVRKTRQSIA